MNPTTAESTEEFAQRMGITPIQKTDGSWEARITGESCVGTGALLELHTHVLKGANPPSNDPTNPEASSEQTETYLGFAARLKLRIQEAGPHLWHAHVTGQGPTAEAALVALHTFVRNNAQPPTPNQSHEPNRTP